MTDAKIIADSYAVVSNHLGTLMHELDNDDPWGVEAFYAWQEVEDELYLLDEGIDLHRQPSGTRKIGFV